MNKELKKHLDWLDKIEQEWPQLLSEALTKSETKTQLSVELGVRYLTLVQWIKGHSKPSLESIIKVVTYLDSKQ